MILPQKIAYVFTDADGTVTLTAAETARYSTAVALGVRRAMVLVSGSVDVRGLLYRRQATGDRASSAVICSGTDVLRASLKELQVVAICNLRVSDVLHTETR